MVNEEKGLVTNEEVTTGTIMSFEDLRQSSITKMDLLTNITDKKELYNIDNTEVDSLLNDCVGEKIRITKVLVKLYEKQLEEPAVDDLTGEIKSIEKTASTIIIDESGKTYATGSRSFTWQLIRFLRDYGQESLEQGLDIEIIKKKLPNSQNKALGFKLI